ncbi:MULTISPECIES: hypothetical protein [Nostoc]|uniref:Uncharacterized protein n=2 Tax=Nostoc TaxID=1177 RepID=A0ABR8IID5_9NOSO|nr:MULTISPECIES: hypothetical protein [Nostoc]MBD2564777.1 hypothetical protein [Nostoc linckia FACHB-391]MBD2650659.1 hypothetical protein [Nostoc foliaceum FACHB-393]
MLLCTASDNRFHETASKTIGRQGKLLKTLAKDKKGILAVSFSDDDKLIGLPAYYDTVILVYLSGKMVLSLGNKLSSGWRIYLEIKDNWLEMNKTK